MSTFRLLSAKRYQKLRPVVASQLEKATANARFLRANHKKLVRQYPSEWVAIADDRIVGHGPDLPKLTDKLSRKGFAPADILTHFVSATKQVFIL